MIGVALGGQVHEQGRLAVQPERAGRNERCLDAVGLPVPQHPAYRAQRGASLLEVGVQTGYELLHALRRAQRYENAAFFRGEAEFGRGGPFGAAHRLQLCREEVRQASKCGWRSG